MIGDTLVAWGCPQRSAARVPRTWRGTSWVLPCQDPSLCPPASENLLGRTAGGSGGTRSGSRMPLGDGGGRSRGGNGSRAGDSGGTHSGSQAGHGGGTLPGDNRETCSSGTPRSRAHSDSRTHASAGGGTPHKLQCWGDSGTYTSASGGTPSSNRTHRDDSGGTSTPNPMWDQGGPRGSRTPVGGGTPPGPSQSHQLCTSWTEGVRRTRSGSRLISFMMLERRTGSSCRRKAKEVFSQALLEPGGTRGGTRAEPPARHPQPQGWPHACSSAGGDCRGNWEDWSRSLPMRRGSLERMGLGGVSRLSAQHSPVQPSLGLEAPRGRLGAERDLGTPKADPQGCPQHPLRWGEQIPGDKGHRQGAEEDLGWGVPVLVGQDRTGRHWGPRGPPGCSHRPQPGTT